MLLVEPANESALSRREGWDLFAYVLEQFVIVRSLRKREELASTLLKVHVENMSIPLKYLDELDLDLWEYVHPFYVGGK